MFITIIVFIFFNTTFALDCNPYNLRVCADTGLSISVNDKGYLNNSEYDENQVIEKDVKDIKNQTITFKNDLFGKKEIRESATVTVSPNGVRTISCNYNYSARSDENSELQKKALSHEKPKYSWVKTQQSITTDGSGADCSVDQIAYTFTETDYAGRTSALRKVKDVYYDRSLCEQLHKLQLDDGIELKACSDKLTRASTIISQRMKELTSEGKTLALSNSRPWEDSNPDRDVYKAVRTLDSCAYNYSPKRVIGSEIIKKEEVKKE